VYRFFALRGEKTIHNKDKVPFHRTVSTPTLATLRAIHIRHATMIPFENLTPLLRQPVRLDLASLQNLLLRAVLLALGSGCTDWLRGFAGTYRMRLSRRAGISCCVSICMDRHILRMLALAA
jgi:hypothetical protein